METPPEQPQQKKHEGLGEGEGRQRKSKSKALPRKGHVNVLPVGGKRKGKKGESSKGNVVRGEGMGKRQPRKGTPGKVVKLGQGSLLQNGGGGTGGIRLLGEGGR